MTSFFSGLSYVQRSPPPRLEIIFGGLARCLALSACVSRSGHWFGMVSVCAGLCTSVRFAGYGVINSSIHQASNQSVS